MPYKNVEKRKEKSRDAARSRRGKEGILFTELTDLLPLPSATKLQLDKATVTRIAISHVKLSSLLGRGKTQKKTRSVVDTRMDRLYCRALDCFLLVIDSSSSVVCVSENVNRYLGIEQISLIGHNVLDLIHPLDQDELYHQLSDSVKKPNDLVNLYLRTKCIQQSKGRHMQLKSATYRLFEYTGKWMKSTQSTSSSEELSYLVLIGRFTSIRHGDEVNLTSNSFITRHSLDMKFVSCDDRVENILGYSAEDLIGQSVYDYHHGADEAMVQTAYKTLFMKGEMKSGLYRFLAKNGGHLWLETQAFLTRVNNGKPFTVICIHTPLSGLREDNHCISAGVQIGEGPICLPPLLAASVKVELDAKSNVNMKGNLLADVASPLEANEVSLQSELDIDEADSSLFEAICQQADLSTEDLFNFQLQLDQILSMESNAPFSPWDKDTPIKEDLHAPYIPMDDGDSAVFPLANFDSINLTSDSRSPLLGVTENLYDQLSDDAIQPDSMLGCLDHCGYNKKNNQAMNSSIPIGQPRSLKTAKDINQQSSRARVMQNNYNIGRQQENVAASNVDGSVLLNLLISGEDKMNGYSIDNSMPHTTRVVKALKCSTLRNMLMGGVEQGLM